MRGVIFGIFVIFLVNVLYANTSYVDMSKSYRLATVVGDTGNVYDRHYYRKNIYYY